MSALGQGERQLSDCLLHELIALPLDVGLGKVGFGLAVRDTDNPGKLVGSALELAFIAPRQRVRIDGIDLGTVSLDSKGGVVAIAEGGR